MTGLKLPENRGNNFRLPQVWTLPVKSKPLIETLRKLTSRSS
jgi:hypothetical protein